MKRIKAIILVFIICIMSCVWGEHAEAAVTALNITYCSMYTGETFNLTLKNANGQVKFVSSNKKVVTVKTSGLVTAKGRGTATVTATYKGKKYKCKVTVRGKYDMMYDYLKINGKKNAQGFMEVNGVSGNRVYSILYNTKKKRFEFKFICDSKSSMYGVTSYVGRNGSRFVSTSFMFVKNSNGRYFFGTADIERSKYSKTYNLPLKITESYGATKASHKENATVIMRRAMYSWNSLMTKKLGVSMQDIGFRKY